MQCSTYYCVCCSSLQSGDPPFAERISHGQNEVQRSRREHQLGSSTEWLDGRRFNTGPFTDLRPLGHVLGGYTILLLTPLRSSPERDDGAVPVPLVLGFSMTSFHPWIEADTALIRHEAIITGRLFRRQRFTTTPSPPLARQHVSLEEQFFAGVTSCQVRLTGEQFNPFPQGRKNGRYSRLCRTRTS